MRRAGLLTTPCVSLGTDCSGMETPALALRGLGLRVDHLFASETDQAAWRIILANGTTAVRYEDAGGRDHEDAGGARQHPR